MRFLSKYLRRASHGGRRGQRGTLAFAGAFLAWAAAGLPAAGQTNFATLAPDGAWCWFGNPRALFHQGILYFGYVRNADGKSALSAFNPQTGQSTFLWQSGFTQVDDHNNPGLLSRQDGTLLALYARHGTDQYFCYRESTATNPVTPADWGAEKINAPTGAGLTYCNPYQLAAETGKVFSFSRNLNFNPTLFTSTNGGSTWSPPQPFIRTGAGGTRPYVQYASDYDRRIEVLYTDGHPDAVTCSLYHLYYEAGNFRKTDGTYLRSLTNLPILHDSGERGSVIYPYSAAPQADPNEWIPTGRAWCWDIANAGGTNLACVFSVQRDNVTGTNWTDDRIYYYYGRWTGTNWQRRFIAHAGRPLYSSQRDYAGGITLDPEDPAVVYFAGNAQDPFNLSDTTNVPLRANSRYEIWKGVTADGGLTFSWTMLTTNSAKDNLRPYVPRNHGGHPTVLWYRGTYTTYTSFQTAMVGLFSTPIPQPPTLYLAQPAASTVLLTNLSNRLHLEAVASDDGLPGPLAVAWTTASGPTNAEFSSSASTSTTARLPLAGTYVLRAIASDGLATATSEVTVVAGALPGDGPDASRVLWLRLDEADGTTAFDSSGNDHDGAVIGGATWQPAGGRRAGALDFDGTNALVAVADAPLLDGMGAFTLAYWFQADSMPTGRSPGLVSKRDGPSSNNCYTTYLNTTDKRLYVDVDNSNNRFNSNASIETGAWYHVAVVFDGTQPSNSRVRLWLNGRVDRTASESSTNVANYPSLFRVGNTHSNAVNWLDGLVDDVRLYRRALGTGEVAMLAATNLAPSVDPGAAPACTSGVPVLLAGAAVDDGQGGPLSVAWTLAAGPGMATLDPAGSAATTATFDRAGAYVLRLTADDTTTKVSADLALDVQSNPNVYVDWIAGFFPGVTNAATVASGADPDGDRVVNAVEFALGMNPDADDDVTFGPGVPGLPQGAMQSIGGTSYLTLIVRRPIGRLGVTCLAESSGDFETWIPSVLASGPTPNGDGTETLVFRDAIPAALDIRRAMRLIVTMP